MNTIKDPPFKVIGVNGDYVVGKSWSEGTKDKCLMYYKQDRFQHMEESQSRILTLSKADRARTPCVDVDMSRKAFSETYRRLGLK